MPLKTKAEIGRLQTAGLYRQLKSQQNLSPTESIIEGRRVTLFASNDYLGLSCHPQVVAAAAEAVQKQGCSAGASRLISGNLELYGQLEASLAELKGKEAALVFASGYAANVGLLQALSGSGDVIYMDRLNHASLYDGWRLSGAELKRYPHCDLERLEKQLAQRAPFQDGRCLIVTDGVFSMDGDLAPLPELKRLADRFDSLLIVDDAHGTGVLGSGGRGTAAHLGVALELEMGTLSKALGSLGGFVSGSREAIELLINKARPFIFSTGLPPAVLAAAHQAIAVMRAEGWRRKRVLELADMARRYLSEAGFKVPEGITPIVPVIIGGEREALRLAELCRQKGVFIPAVRTPAVPKNQARLRLTLSALHSDSQLEQALEVMVAAGRELGLV